MQVLHSTLEMLLDSMSNRHVVSLRLILADLALPTTTKMGSFISECSFSHKGQSKGTLK